MWAGCFKPELATSKLMIK